MDNKRPDWWPPNSYDGFGAITFEDGLETGMKVLIRELEDSIIATCYSAEAGAEVVQIAVEEWEKIKKEIL